MKWTLLTCRGTKHPAFSASLCMLRYAVTFFSSSCIFFFWLLNNFRVTHLSPKPACWFLWGVALQWTIFSAALTPQKDRTEPQILSRKEMLETIFVFCWFQPRVCTWSELYRGLKLELWPTQKVFLLVRSWTVATMMLWRKWSCGRGADSVPDVGDLG